MKRVIAIFFRDLFSQHSHAYQKFENIKMILGLLFYINFHIWNWNFLLRLNFNKNLRYQWIFGVIKLISMKLNHKIQDLVPLGTNPIRAEDPPTKRVLRPIGSTDLVPYPLCSSTQSFLIIVTFTFWLLINGFLIK